MARPADRRRPQLPRPGGAASRGLRLRGDRPCGRERALARRPPTERMQAIVLVGGEGTRLRPLTETVPKPALTLVDRPFLAYMIEWLAGHGVTEVVLACGFLPDVLREALRRGGAGRGPHPLRRRARAARHRRRDPLRRRRSSATSSSDRFLALNGDVLTDLDLSALLARPRASGAPRRRSACTRSRTPPPTAWSGAARAGRCSSSSRRPASAAPGEVNAGHVRARALGARPDPARRERLDRARRLPAAGRRGPPRAARSTATGWTSAPPSATCRRAGTSSRARWRPAGRADRAGQPWSTAGAEVAEAARRSGRGPWSARLPGRAPARRSASRSCSTAATVGEGARVAARSSRPGPEVGPAPTSTAPWRPG